MEFDVSTVGPCRKKVAVKVPPARVQEEFDRQYDEINKNFALPGFRKGRAPRRLLEKRFGDKLGGEVKEGLVKAALEKLVEDKKVDPLAPPHIDLEALPLDASKSFDFEFELVTKPDFETPTWKGVEVKVPAATVTDEEVAKAVDGLRRRRATLETAPDGKVALGDVVVVDWRAKSGDSIEARDDGVYYGVGRGVLAGFVAEGLDAALDGQSAGAEVRAKVRVPADDPREELRGRELDLEVVLKEVKRYVLPPVDADFLKAFDYDDEAEMKEDVRKKILRAKRRDIERHAEDALVDQLLGKVEMSLPPEFVQRELEAWASRRRMAGQMEGVAEDEVVKQIDAARGDAETAIERDMRRFFLLDRIADAEGIHVTEAEMVEAIQEIASAYGRPEEEVLASFRSGDRLSELRSQIRHRKTREAMLKQASLVEEAPPAAPVAAEETSPPKHGGKKK